MHPANLCLVDLDARWTVVEQLLGVHFTSYAAALAAVAHPGIHRSLRVESPGLIVELGGHLRAYVGRAYLAALMPAGVTAAEFL